MIIIKWGVIVLENYMVMWGMYQKLNKKGFVNRLLGKHITVIKPVIHEYETLELAEECYRRVKTVGGYQPKLVKVIKEG